MEKDAIISLFDGQAATYDEQWKALAPIKTTLHLLGRAVAADLPPDARILCVGAGTGDEILHLAGQFPGWHFTAVEPSTAMLAVCRRRVEEHGLTARCRFHAGYVSALTDPAPWHAATAFLVSQFILDEDERTGFFREIADRLVPSGLLLSADLAGSLDSDLLPVWLRVMSGGGLTAEKIQSIREAYSKDVGVMQPEEVCRIISLGGFTSPVQYYQAGMIHAWYARRR